MRMIACRTLAVALVLASAPAAWALSCAAFKTQLQQTYGFRPSQLDAKALDVKSEKMDAVWQAIHNESALRPCLKEVLAHTGDDWLLFDGAQLLASVDPSRENKELLLTGLTRVSLDDVDLRSWVTLAAKLGVDGFDTSALGARWLDHFDPQYAIPEHAFKVDRATGALFIFGAMDERFATPALTRLAHDKSGPAREIAARLLLSQATKPPAAPFERIVPREKPKTTRAEFLRAFHALLAGDETPFNQLVDAVPDGERDVVAVCTAADLETLRKVRRYYAAKCSPHAIEYYNQFTQILVTMVGKGK